MPRFVLAPLAKPLLPAAALVALLAACTPPPPGVALLEAADPLATDPADIAVLLHLPDGVELAPDGAVLTVSTTNGTQRVSGDYVLERTGHGAGLQQLALSDRDAAALRKLQEQARAWQVSAPDTATGNLSVAFQGCTTAGAPDPAATTAIDVSLDGGDSFYQLMRPTALSDLSIGDELAQMQPCES